VKISNTNPPTPISVGNASGPGRTTGPATAGGGGQTPSVSSSVGQINAKLSDTTYDIDSLRVEEVRQAIISGQLEIDAGKIADGLLENLKGR
jgi:negative regulator of flagellin synthesis FlgM